MRRTQLYPVEFFDELIELRVLWKPLTQLPARCLPYTRAFFKDYLDKLCACLKFFKPNPKQANLFLRLAQATFLRPLDIASHIQGVIFQLNLMVSLLVAERSIQPKGPLPHKFVAEYVQRTTVFLAGSKLPFFEWIMDAVRNPKLWHNLCAAQDVVEALTRASS